jgi:glycosyltransferase involved in cell wall biosynthesis
MRVVHVCAYFAPAWDAGGPARSILALCQAQQAAGIDVDVFTTTANGRGELAPQPAGTVFGGVPVRYFPLTRPKAIFAAASMRAPLAAAVRQADVVHVHGLFNATVWMATRTAAAQGVPYVISPRGMLEPPALRHHQTRKRAAWALFDRAALHRAALWHATSPFEAATLRRRDAAAPVVEIPNPVALTASDATQEATPLRAADGGGDPYVLFLGRLHPIKRLDLLAASFARVRAAVPDARLVIAGPDELGTRAAVEPAFRGIAAGVDWIGAVDGPAKRALLERARALVMCSDSESFGMSVAEAMAAATPVVVTRTCPWPVVETAACGYWVDQTSGAIAGALIDLLRDPARARAMGARGHAVIAREFSPQAVGARWRDVYGRVVVGRAREAVSLA